MKKDISSREDIIRLVDKFYDHVRSDEVIGFLFNEIARVDWQKHLPRMYDFWENIVFQSGSYNGNPMIVHAQLHQKYPLSRRHFDRWLNLFESTVDDLFEGEKARLIKMRAASIAVVMQHNVIGKETG
ncbi:MAG: group III truncated hemoglobin [Chitinophagales bacterium]